MGHRVVRAPALLTTGMEEIAVVMTLMGAISMADAVALRINPRPFALLPISEMTPSRNPACHLYWHAAWWNSDSATQLDTNCIHSSLER